MIEFKVEKCRTKATYSAKPKQQLKMDLNKIKSKFEVVLETPVLLVIKAQGVEAIVHGYGEILFKNCKDIELMTKIAEEIYGSGAR